MDCKTPWLEIEPVDSPIEIAKFIVHEYYRISRGHLPTQEKLQEMMYFCCRDAFLVTGHPVTDATFTIQNGCLMSITPMIPSIAYLANSEPEILDGFVKDTMGSVLPNYAQLESWCLREQIKTLCKHVCGTVSPTTNKTLALGDIWEDAKRNPPFDYYLQEPMIPEENDI